MATQPEVKAALQAAGAIDTDERHPGQIVYRHGDPDDAWVIIEFRSKTDKSYAFCQFCANGKKPKPDDKGPAAQWFPTGALATVPTPRPAVPCEAPPPMPRPQAEKPAGKEPRPPRPPRATSIGDDVAALLAEAKDLAGCWEIAKAAGLDVPTVQAKIAHLSNGLQRMGIGNRLRAHQKSGGFDPAALLAKMAKGKK